MRLLRGAGCGVRMRVIFLFRFYGVSVMEKKKTSNVMISDAGVEKNHQTTFSMIFVWVCRIVMVGFLVLGVLALMH